MPAIIAAILAWAARILPALFSLTRLIALFKSFLSFGLFTIGLPLAVNWGLFKVAQNFGPAVFKSLGLQAQTIQFTGMTAWLASALKLPLCMTVMLGFVTKRAAITLTRIGGPLSKFTTDRFS